MVLNKRITNRAWKQMRGQFDANWKIMMINRKESSNSCQVAKKNAVTLCTVIHSDGNVEVALHHLQRDRVSQTAIQSEALVSAACLAGFVRCSNFIRRFWDHVLCVNWCGLPVARCQNRLNAYLTVEQRWRLLLGLCRALLVQLLSVTWMAVIQCGWCGAAVPWRLSILWDLNLSVVQYFFFKLDKLYTYI